jgi:ribonuclease HII
VDDAGRGSAIGPLIIAGVLFREDQVQLLKSIGVKDSKLLSSERRTRLAGEIKDLALDYCITEVSPQRVDEVVMKGRRLHKLNLLEAEMMAEVIKELKPDIAYVDASDVMAERYGEQIRARIPFPVSVISEHKADVTYPVVSAAAIVAKARRDEIITELRRRYGDFGSGYTTDPRTLRFLRRLATKTATPPDFVRRSWRSVQKVWNEAKQSKF